MRVPHPVPKDGVSDWLEFDRSMARCSVNHPQREWDAHADHPRHNTNLRAEPAAEADKERVDVGAV